MYLGKTHRPENLKEWKKWLDLRKQGLSAMKVAIMFGKNVSNVYAYTNLLKKHPELIDQSTQEGGEKNAQ
jgi:hypothetical protein